MTLLEVFNLLFSSLVACDIRRSLSKEVVPKDFGPAFFLFFTKQLIKRPK